MQRKSGIAAAAEAKQVVLLQCSISAKSEAPQGREAEEVAVLMAQSDAHRSNWSKVIFLWILQQFAGNLPLRGFLAFR
jgi:hypothetical protein